MKALYDISAPAKLNTFLHITGRHADGYHLLQSIFMLIDWCDKLHFELRADGEISREDLGATLPAQDLMVRAATALRQASGCRSGVHMAIDKHIPMQAGMGGGSSDAASTLLALNQLWGLHLPLTELMRIGLGLGADVPFFLGGHNAWVEGIGEALSPMALPAAQFLVVKPAHGLATQEIFSDASLKRDSKPATIAGFAQMGATDIFKFGRNDLQAVAQRLCPGVDQALRWLDLQGLSGRMTGSGSAVFAHVAHGFELQSDVALPAHFEFKLCDNLQAHPLLGWAKTD